MKLRTKLVIFIAASMAIMIAAGTTSVIFSKKSQQSYDLLIHKDENLRFYLKSIQFRLAGLSNDERAYLLTGDQAFTAEMKAKQADVSAYIASLESLALNDAEREIVQKMKENYGVFEKASNEVLQAYGKGEVSRAKAVHFGEERSARKELDPIISDFLKEEQENMTASIAGTEQRTAASNLVLEILAAASVVFGAAMGFLMLRSLRPLHTINKQLKSIAEGSADLTREIQVSSKDEIRSLADSYNAMLGNLRTIIGEAQSSALHVAASAEQLSAGARQVQTSSEQIAGLNQELAAGSDRQLAETQSAAAIISRMNTGISDIADSSKEVRGLAAAASAVSERGGASLQEVVALMQDVDQHVQSGFAVVQELNSRSQEIEGIIGMMNGIANQTNLLALNAAIEAARAGEAGRGFQIVAQEVRKLAEQSVAFAGQISALISEIRSGTVTAVASMRQGSEQVRSGVGQARQVQEVFGDIQTSFGAVSHKIGTVTESIELLTEGSSRLDEAASSLSLLAGSGAAASQQTSSASQEQLAAAEEMAASIQQLSETADSLSAMLKEFSCK